jgi:hypothetical protein
VFVRGVAVNDRPQERLGALDDFVETKPTQGRFIFGEERSEATGDASFWENEPKPMRGHAFWENEPNPTGSGITLGKRTEPNWRRVDLAKQSHRGKSAERTQIDADGRARLACGHCVD